ncbi:hypothetical protein EON80_01415 [bacterium]|nr:MAG: hypothetical protein EON80_01415 [bacterium]
MKVDLGTCAACGAKNSKFVESCYKCGAKLPWAAGYVAPDTAKPKTAPQATPPVAQPKAQPSAAPAGGTKTVISPSVNVPIVDDEKESLTDRVAGGATRRVPVPVWALGLGTALCVGLGMLLVTAFGGRSTNSVTVTPTLAPLPTLAPATSASPVATSPTPSLTPAASVAPTLAPIAVGVTPAASGTPATDAGVTPVATAAPGPVPVAAGPAFDVLYLNTSSGTTEQKNAYWATVQNTKVSWRGNFVSLGNSPHGPLLVRCTSGTNSALVTVSLSTNPPETLPAMQPNQSIAIEGILTGYSAQGYALGEGRAN